MTLRLPIAILIIISSTFVACTAETDAAREPFELSIPQGSILLEVTGIVANRNSENGAQFDLAMLRKLPAIRLSTSTSVTDGVQTFEGFLLRDFLASLGASGTIVQASALNDYTVNIPMSDIERYDVIVAHSMNGQPLSPHDKGPLWIVYPRDQHSELQDIRYDYRWVWQLNALHLK